MKVLLLALGQDLAGQHAAIKAALAAHRPDWVVRQMRATDTYLQYPAELMYQVKHARDLYNWSDIVHTNHLAAITRFGVPRGPFIPARERRNVYGKKVLVHHHGTEFRTKGDVLFKQIKRTGAVQVAATLDLVRAGVEWLPSVADLEWMSGFVQPNPTATVRIAHSPTDRSIKGTETIIRAVQSLKRLGHDVELDVIEKVSWPECLARKGRADIFVDQLQLGYGLSTIEAWAMSIPVVAGSAPDTRTRYLREFGALPFVEANPDTLVDVLLPLVTDREARLRWGQVGLAHAWKYHSQQEQADRLADIYERML